MKPTPQGVASRSPANRGSKPRRATSGTVERGLSSLGLRGSGKVTRCAAADGFWPTTQSTFTRKGSGHLFRQWCSECGPESVSFHGTSGRTGFMTSAAPLWSFWTTLGARWTDSAPVSLRSASASPWKNAGRSGSRFQPTPRPMSGKPTLTPAWCLDSTGPSASISPARRTTGHGSSRRPETFLPACAGNLLAASDADRVVSRGG